MDNTPEFAKPRTWQYQIAVDDDPAITGIFTASEVLAEITLSGMYRVGNWHRNGVKRDGDGRLTGIRLFARSRGRVVSAIAIRVA